MSMGISRMLDQNVYFWLVSGFRHGIANELAVQDWNSVNVIAGFPNNVDDVRLPLVAFYREGFRDTPQQLGSSTDVIRTDTYVATVFASRDGQRDDLAEYLKDIVDNKSKVFLDFNDGFGELDGQAQLGVIDFRLVGMFPVRDLNSQQRTKMHRMNVRFNTEYTYTVS